MAGENVNVGTLSIRALLLTDGIRKGVSAISKMTGAVAAGLGATAAAATAAALHTAMDVEDLTVGLGKASNLSGAELKALRDEIINMGTEMRGISTKELLAISTEVGKLGTSADQIPAVTKNLAMLATTIDDIPVEELANSMGKLTSNYGLDAAKGMLQIGSAVDALADSGTSSAGDIIQAMGKASGNARLLGLTADQTAALSAALLDTGSTADATGGTLSRLFGSVANEAEALDIAKLVNVSPETWKEMIQKEPMKAIDSLIGSLKGKSLGEVQAALSSIGITNKEDQAEIAKLVTQHDNLRAKTALSNEEFTKGTRAQEAYALTAETTRAKLDQFWNVLVKLGVTVGDAILPIINNALDSMIPHVAEFAATFANWASGAPATTGILGDVINILTLAGKAVVDAFAEIANVFWKTISMFGVGKDTADQAQRNVQATRASFMESYNKMFDPETILKDMQPKEDSKPIADAISTQVADAVKAAGANLSDSPAPTTAPKSSGSPFADAVYKGSQENFAAINRWRTGMGADNSQKMVADNTADIVVETRATNRILRTMTGNGMTALPIG